jgi:hypothetical protein
LDKTRCGRSECVKGCTYCAFLDEWEKIRQANTSGKARPYSNKEWYAVTISDGTRILTKYE